MTIQSKLNHFLIGIGNKARAGKDTLAKYIKELYPNTVILHWADNLRKELHNIDNNGPLITQTITPDNIIQYNIYDCVDRHYHVYDSKQVPKLHNLFTTRQITVYDRMIEKDSEMLQFWGTDYRRKTNPNYWINALRPTIDELFKNQSTPEPFFVIIPDTRFRNEYLTIKEYNGIYIKIKRLNEDGSLYIDSDRDATHKSEIELDNYFSDYTVSAKSGDLEEIKAAAFSIIKNLLKT